MKKYISAILAAALALCAMTACGDNDSSSKKSESSSVSESSSASDSSLSESGSDSQSDDINELSDKTYCKDAYNYAAKYCTDKDEAGDTVTFSVWEFNPTHPDKDEEFEVYIAEQLGDSAKSGYLSFHFENGMVTSTEYKNREGEVIAKYPEE